MIRINTPKRTQPWKSPSVFHSHSCILKYLFFPIFCFTRGSPGPRVIIAGQSPFSWFGFRQRGRKNVPFSVFLSQDLFSFITDLDISFLREGGECYRKLIYITIVTISYYCFMGPATLLFVKHRFLLPCPMVLRSALFSGNLYKYMNLPFILGHNYPPSNLNHFFRM